MICSRSTVLMPSMRSCISRNRGMRRETSTPTITSSTGTDTQTSHDRPTSSRSAMMMPPMHMIGVETMKFRVMSTSSCTCCTSLVPRVMRVPEPNRLSSRAPSESTLRYTSRRRSRPTAMAVRAPK